MRVDGTNKGGPLVMIWGDATLFLEHADIQKTQSILGTSEMDIVVILTQNL